MGSASTSSILRVPRIGYARSQETLNSWWLVEAEVVVLVLTGGREVVVVLEATSMILPTPSHSRHTPSR